MGRLKRCLIAAVLTVASAAIVHAADYYAFEQITVAAVSIGFTNATIVQGTTHKQATQAVCRVETAQLRYRFDGTAPTSAVGTLLEIGDTLTISEPISMVQFRAIRTGAVSGVLSCSYVG